MWKVQALDVRIMKELMLHVLGCFLTCFLLLFCFLLRAHLEAKAGSMLPLSTKLVGALDPQAVVVAPLTCTTHATADAHAHTQCSDYF